MSDPSNRCLLYGVCPRCQQRLLPGMHADGLRQIAVAGLIPRYQLAEQGQHAEGVCVI